MSWTYAQPVEIVFETGGLGRLAQICRGRGWQKGILVCDPYFADSGLARALLGESGGLLLGVYAKVTPNPLLEEVDACAALLRDCAADFAVAVGGGSAIDCAKAACAVAAGGGNARDYHSGQKALPTRGLPLVAVPTTAGTGTEATSVSVLTDPALGKKAPMGGPALYPRVALVDPALTVSLPPAVTASCGLDALSHALEAFWSKNHQPVCDALALHAAGLVFEWLPRAWENGADLAAREKMSEASVLAGLAFVLPKTAAAHAISFPLTNRYGLPHGEACAFTLGALCGINADERLEGFARSLGFAGAAQMGARIEEMKRRFGMRRTLREAGIPPDEVGELARLSRHPNLDNNPVPLDEAALVALFLSLQGDGA